MTRALADFDCESISITPVTCASTSSIGFTTPVSTSSGDAPVHVTATVTTRIVDVGELAHADAARTEMPSAIANIIVAEHHHPREDRPAKAQIGDVHLPDPIVVTGCAFEPAEPVATVGSGSADASEPEPALASSAAWSVVFVLMETDAPSLSGSAPATTS